MKKAAVVSALALALVLAGYGTAAAQVTQGQMEALGFVGGVTDGGGATFGGGLHFGATPRAVVAVEVGYLTGGEDFSGFGVDVESSGVTVDFNLHYLFPLAGNPRLTPYLLGGLGIVRASASVTGGGVDVDESDTSFGLNVGGGARLSVGENWGVRPELKVFIGDSTFARFSGAFYVAFGR